MNKILELRNKIEFTEEQLIRANHTYGFCCNTLNYYNEELITYRGSFDLYKWNKSRILEFTSKIIQFRIIKEDLESKIKSYNLELTSIILSESNDFNIRFELVVEIQDHTPHYTGIRATEVELWRNIENWNT